ncbi:MAG: hypothetical protein ACRD2U_04325 [Terriglobales bacterium]
MFYFEKLLNMAMTGIDGTSVVPTVTNFAFAILLVGFLVGLYQAALRGGDVQALAVTAIKYLVVAMIIANWASVFRSVNGSFTSAADYIGNSSGAGDMFLSWMTQLQQQANTNPGLTFWDMINGDIPGAITVLLLLVAYLVYALAIIVFCFFYTLYGSVLYVLGPLVLALLPVSGIGQLGRTYGINLMIWNAWALLYAIFGALITAIQVNRVNDVLGHEFLGFLEGVPDSVMLGLVSIFYALAVALIPFIAKRIISGDVGSIAFALVRAGAFAAGGVLAGATGFMSGASAGSSAGSSGGAGAGAGTAGSAGIASSMPPPTPSMSSFLRSGIAGAMNSNTSPAATPPRANGNGDSGNDTRQVSTAAGANSQGSGYRPQGVAQVITFRAAKALGKVAGGNNRDDND